MLIEQTLQIFADLNLLGMKQALQNQRHHPKTHDLSFDERLGLLVIMRKPTANADTYKSVSMLLDKGLDRKPLRLTTEDMPPAFHPNIRGANYYKKGVQYAD